MGVSTESTVLCQQPKSQTVWSSLATLSLLKQLSHVCSGKKAADRVLQTGQLIPAVKGTKLLGEIVW